MKNINSLLARLGTLSLAAVLVFSVANAATNRKEVTSALIESLVNEAAKENKENRAVAVQQFSQNVVIGKPTAGNNLLVNGKVQVFGDIAAGAQPASQLAGATGPQYVIGSQPLDPRTQQFELRFKDKTKNGAGAFLDLSFVTTATSSRLPLADNGVVSLGVRVAGIYAQPQMSHAAIQNVYGSVANPATFKETTTVRLYNAPARTAANDFRLTPTVRIETITNNVAFGFVPWSASYPATGGANSSGFYEANWGNTSYATAQCPKWFPGTVSYSIKSSNLAGYGVVTAVTDTLQPLDVFTLFTDADLQTLLGALNAYFGNNSTKVREYLEQHGHDLSKVIKAIDLKS